MREEAPSPQLAPRGRALLTQPVADAVLTRVSIEAGQRTPLLPRGGGREGGNGT